MKKITENNLYTRLTNNLPMKLLSVVLAFFVWLLVTNINDPETTRRFYDIPVHIVNEDALTDRNYGYEILEGKTVDITVTGKKSVMRKVSAASFTATADLSKLSDVYAVPIKVTAGPLTESLDIRLMDVDTLKVKIDKKISVSVPVTTEVTGEPATGYAVGKKSSTPNLIEITGPQSLVDTAKEVRVSLSVAGATSDVTDIVKPAVYNISGDRIDEDQIEMDTSSIRVEANIWKTKEVDVELDYTGSPAEGYELVSFNYEPQKLTITAPDDELDEIDKITLESVSIDGLTKNYEEDIDLTQITLPGNVTLTDETTDIKVKAVIEKLDNYKVDFKKKDIRVDGGDGYTVTYDEDNEYVITVYGTKTTVSKLKGKDFDPWINVEGLEAGSHDMTVHVKEVEGVSIQETPTIGITLKTR